MKLDLVGAWRGRALPVVLLLVTASVLVTVAPGQGRSAAGRIPKQVTPKSPVYRGVPGALPPHFVYRYNRLSVGWPVLPRGIQHPIRGAFADPRGRAGNGLSGYHFGADVNVDDEHPNAGAPPGLSHRVYALESGRAKEPRNVQRRVCANRRIEVGHFQYWHVSPIVRSGRRVRAGQQIGWTCIGQWHVHVSEWQLFRGRRVWVNPLHKGGALRPYTDSAPPIVSRLRFVTPPATPWRPRRSLAEPDSSRSLSPLRLHGVVELRARVGDPQSFLGFLARRRGWPTLWSPYSLRVVIRHARTGLLVMRRTTFRVDQLPQTPYLVHYAPGTVEDASMSECVGPRHSAGCDGVTWFRPFSRFHLEYWDTWLVPNGPYRVTVYAGDIAGYVGSRSIVVVVKN